MGSAGRLVARGGVAASLVVGFLMGAAGCGATRGQSDEPRSTTVPVDGVCILVEVPVETMRKHANSFAEVVEDQMGRGADRGVSAMVAFAVLARSRDEAGEFEPVIAYLAARGAAEASASAEPPQLTDSIRANARKLDRFLADGGCG